MKKKILLLFSSTASPPFTEPGVTVRDLLSTSSTAGESESASLILFFQSLPETYEHEVRGYQR